MALPRSLVDFLSSAPAQAVIWMTTLVFILLIATYVVKKFRDGIDEDRGSANELLTNFREMNREGDISDAEFRTIRNVLGERLQTELKDSGDTG
jgi:uncharacterized membrane protein